MPKDKVVPVIAFLILVSLGGEVVVLSLQNNRLKAATRTFLEMQIPRTLRIGSEVPPLNLENTSGDRMLLEFSVDDPITLLFVFNTNCPSCKKTVPLWNRLSDGLLNCVKTAAVTSDSTELIASYQRDYMPTYSLFAVPQESLSENYKASVLPQTILIGEGGVVLGVWPGELNDLDIENIKRIIVNQEDNC